MNRRRFIEAAASSLFISPGLVLAETATPGRGSGAADVVFYDDRFVQAQRLAAGWPGSPDLRPVGSDVTALWNDWLKEACQRSMLVLDGITTESFHFCLKILVAERTGIETRIARIDRDLFLWRIHCGPLVDRSVFA